MISNGLSCVSASGISFESDITPMLTILLSTLFQPVPCLALRFTGFISKPFL
jgi:hypothetical protein